MTYHVPVPAPDVAVCAPAGGLRHASLAVHHHPLRSQGIHFPLASEVVLVALTEQAVLLAEAWLELREESWRSDTTDIQAEVKPSTSSCSSSSNIVLIALTGLTVLDVDCRIEGTKVRKLWL